MTFAALRQTVLQGHLLNDDKFAEDVEIGAPDGSDSTVTARVKIEHDEYRPVRKQGYNDAQSGTLDERERIRVVFSRDPMYAGAYVSRPPPACPLCRAASVDTDRRPFAFRGDVAFEGDQHAVYIFERPRRAVQGKGT